MKLIANLLPKQLTTKNSAVQGSLWTILGYGSGQVLRFASNLILTRLLYPELFGLMALLNTFVMGLWLLSDVGVNLSIIQNERGDDPDFFNTAWTLQVIRGCGLWCLSLLMAWPLSVWYEDIRLIWLIPIISLSVIFLGFSSPNLPLLKRNLEFGKVVLFELSSQFIVMIITILWAWVHPTIFALVGGALFGKAITVLLSYRLIPETVSKFTWNKEWIQEIFSFGKWIFLSTFLTFFASQFDKLILPKFLGFEFLGIYIIAITLADLPRIIGQRISRQVMFPILSKKSALPRVDLRGSIERKRFLFLISLAIFISTLASFGDFLILGLYDENYSAAAWMFPILVLGVWPNIVFATYNSSLLAIGQSIYGAWGQFAKLLYMVIMIPLGFYKLSILGVILIIAFNDIPLYLSSLFGAMREKVSFFKQDLAITFVLASTFFLIIQIRFYLGITLNFPF